MVPLSCLISDYFGGLVEYDDVRELLSGDVTYSEEVHRAVELYHRLCASPLSVYSPESLAMHEELNELKLELQRQGVL